MRSRAPASRDAPAGCAIRGVSAGPPVPSRSPMLSRIDLRGREADLRTTLRRANPSSEPIADAVQDVIDAVRARGDEALRELTERFDGCRVDDFRVPAESLQRALRETDPQLRAALEFTRDQVLAWHEA